jgi:hypothetical protein
MIWLLKVKLFSQPENKKPVRNKQTGFKTFLSGNIMTTFILRQALPFQFYRVPEL